MMPELFNLFQEMDIKRETLQMDVEQKRKMADNATTEVAVLEEMLDRTAQLYRQMHDERCALLKQWEASVRALHRKDHDINRTLSVISSTIEILSSRGITVLLCR